MGFILVREAILKSLATVIVAAKATEIIAREFFDFTKTRSVDPVSDAVTKEWSQFSKKAIKRYEKGRAA